MYTVNGKDKDPASFIKIKTDPIDIESEMKHEGVYRKEPSFFDAQHFSFHLKRPVRITRVFCTAIKID